MKRFLIPASLLLLAGCQQPGPDVPRPYAAAEEGLTLAYINPSLPQDQQAAQRLQVRVDKVMDRADGAQVAFKSFTVGVHPPFQSTFVVKDGGVGLLSPDGKSELLLLPEGFPDKTASWSRAGVQFRILGRGAWLMGAKVLPADRNADGVWVEARTGQGAVSRSLYLPAFGEVQTDERQADGRWVTVNLLTQYGFTDLPAAPQGDQPVEPPAKKRATKMKPKH